MSSETFIFCLLIAPVVSALICFLLPSPRVVLRWITVSIWSIALLTTFLIYRVLTRGPIYAADRWLYIDALSAFNIGVMILVFALSSLYADHYFANQSLDLRRSRQFGALWMATMGSMLLVLTSNHLGIQWASIEATTLITSFLICTHVTPASLEAMWKYLIICSVGVTFAFLGVLFLAAAMEASSEPTALLWTDVRAHAAYLDPHLLRSAFVFILIGYGTKAGLAPLHSWLPDAHSQAPAPVSAVFSGFLLNTAMYCIMRVLSITAGNQAVASWSLHLLAFFGILSMLVAAAFIIFQHDLKRLLAYHSVEHLGIIALGLGTGGLGVFAALFHTLNHSLCKTLAFFAAGRLGHVFGSYDMSTISNSIRVSPAWGIALLGSLLALIGVAPFALFMSEFQLIVAAVNDGAWISIILFLAASGIVFFGALHHAISMSWGNSEKNKEPSSKIEWFLVLVPLSLLLILGIGMPAWLRSFIEAAASIIGAQP